MSYPASRVFPLVALLAFSAPTIGLAKDDNSSPAGKDKKGSETSSDTPAKSKRSKAFRAGAKAFKKKKYKRAIELFEKAFQQEGSKAALFAWAQAQRLAGKCKGAYFNYSRLLRMNPTAQQLGPVQYGMRACEKKLGPAELDQIRARLDRIERERKEREQREALRRQREEMERKRRLAEAERRREREAGRREQEKALALLRDEEEPAGRAPAYFMMVSGAVLALAGGGSFYLALDYRDREAETYQEQLDNNDRAETWGLLSTIGLAGGGGLMAAGLVYWLAVGGDDAREQAVVLGSGPGDMGLAIGGRF
jgi:hypothetical protein